MDIRIKNTIFSLVVALLASFCMCGVVSANTIKEGVKASIKEEDLMIDEETAVEIAKLFLQDMIKIDDVKWTRDTVIIDTVTLFADSSKDEASAYSIKLSEGYIIVSAYIDVPNMILEWSDLATPLHEVFETSERNRYIYTGPLCYYKDCLDGSVEALDGTRIPYEKIKKEKWSQRDVSNVPPEIIDIILNERQDSKNGTTMRSSGPITNMFIHARELYGGHFSVHDSQNHWGSYLPFHSMAEYSQLGNGYENHCGPTAITNMLIMYGQRFNVSSINNTNHHNIFFYFLTIGIANLYYHNTDFLVFGGTMNALANNYIQNCFSSYGVTVTCPATFYINYTTVERSLRTDNLLYIMLRGNECYGNHHLVGYAYYRLFNNNYTQSATYIRVADGWDTNARYLDIQSIGSDRFWEVSY